MNVNYDIICGQIVELDKMAKEDIREMIKEHEKELNSYRAQLRDLRRMGFDTRKHERIIHKQFKHIKRWKRWLNK